MEAILKHIYKLSFWLVLVIKSNLFVTAQQFGNEWIQYSQSYYKIKIVNDGVYRLPYATLLNAGIPVQTINPNHFQLFRNGKEVAIYVAGEADNSFDSGDYIEFVGLRNDGWLDSCLYINGSADLVNKKFSLFSDTSIYFLTWNNSTNNKRLSVETDVNFGAYTQSPYFLLERVHNYANFYYEGEIFVAGQLSPEYTKGEGYCHVYAGNNTATLTWADGWFPGWQNYLFNTGGNIPLRFTAITGSNPVLGSDHHHRFYVGNQLIKDTVIDGYGLTQYNLQIPSSYLNASQPVFRAEFNSTYSANTRNGLGYLEIHLPIANNLSGNHSVFIIVNDAVGQNKTYYSIGNMSNGGAPTWVYDLTNGKKITTSSIPGSFEVLIPNTGNQKRCFVTSENVFQTVNTIEPVNKNSMTPARFTNFSQQVKDKNYIIITHKDFFTEVEAYRAYRQQKYAVCVADIEELVEQFSYGIINHPQSIRGFMHFAHTNWQIKPEFLFIIGKGLVPHHVRFNSVLAQQVKVPAYGVPAADNGFTFNLDGSMTQNIAVGRLAATSPVQVSDYLNKVQLFENPANDFWKKNVLHLGGGSSLSEQQLLAAYLDNYKNIIEDSAFGGFVTTFLKTSSAPMPITRVDSIKQIIRDGLSIMTVFGHGSGQGFDQNIDDPENYTNYDRHPILIANSCLTGDIFQNSLLLSERFVLAQNKGSVAFLASTSQATSSMLKIFTDSVYSHVAKTYYGEPIGKSIARAVTANTQFYSYNSLLRMTTLDMQLHGDPALVINQNTLPDLEVSASNISFNPSDVTTAIDSFDIQVIFKNNGRALPSGYVLQIQRKFPTLGVADSVYFIQRSSIYYADTVRLKLPVDILNGIGNNTFIVTADPNGLIVESDEGNNTATVYLMIRSGDIIPVYPIDFQVVGKNTLQLIASTGDPFASAKRYKIEIDTTDLFNSPFKRDTIAFQTGGLVKFTPPFQFTDSMVYFWRAGVDSANTGIFYRWQERSFQYIPNKYGWGQAHFFQYKKDGFKYIIANRTNRKLEFVPNASQLKINARPCYDPGDPFFNGMNYSIDGVIQEQSGCGFPALYVAVIDPVSLIPWGTNFNGANPNNVFGDVNCRNRVEKYFKFTLTDPAQLNGLIDLLTNRIPQDYYVAVWTWTGGTFDDPSQWPNALITAFENLGSTQVRPLVNSATSVPFIFFTQYGNNASTIEVVGTHACEDIALSTTIHRKWVNGEMHSTIIGPASKWGSFHWRTHSIDVQTQHDSTVASIIGIDHNGNETVLFPQIATTTLDILNLQNTISASQYPYLKLQLFTQDDSSFTPTQLDSWHVLYEGVPEAALNPNFHFAFKSDTVQQGQDVFLTTAIENIGEYDMDSLTVRYYVLDKNNNTHNFYNKKKPLLVGETILDSIYINTASFSGLNVLGIEVNPLNHPEHQLEQYHFNNLGLIKFRAIGDSINPILDVTFDGIRIMDGDIVSAKPEIFIQLKDENKLLALSDTSAFEVFLKYPNQSNPVQIFLDDAVADFTPASLPDNVCKLKLRPDFTNQDGIYQLLIRAKDRSNNSSGKGDGQFDYKIRFEVINKSTITEVMNYPNPFSSSTQFVFTLTGSEIPTQLTIQILTVSGVVVREITLDELGPIHIGRNITEYKWDGRDEYGDQLATGVYIYRVIAKMNGETIEKRQSGADKFFKKGFGKMYIMR